MSALRPSLSIFSLLLLTGLSCAQTKEGDLDKSPPKGMTPEQIIQRFTANEKEWKNVRQQYAFRQTVTVQVMDGNSVRDEFRQVADVHYAGGNPVKTIVLAPQSPIEMSPEDVQDLDTRATFTISTDELPEYNLTYVGQQQEDDLHCYVFDVAPKQMAEGRRYFQGRIWVDDRDFQIVKDRGKSAPDIRITKKKKLTENLFPQFTTWREQVDGKHWFPTFSSVDDVLHFQTNEVHMKQVLTFTDYRK